MATISAVIITKNEEINITRCIQSVQDIVDEIIVVDSFSTDKTKAICESFPNVQFVQREWKGYAQTKNYAQGLANSEYVLSLDADEELSPELKSEIEKIKSRLNGNEAYYLNRLTNYCGQWIYHSGWLPDYQLRLYPRNASTWEGAHVHERISLGNGIKARKLKGYLNHYSYYSINDHLERAKSYTSLGAKKVLERNEHFLFARAIINPFFRFFKTYFLKKGFLDGRYGFGISVIAAFTVFLKYFKAWQMKQESKG